jgi:hypothetical protein
VTAPDRHVTSGGARFPAAGLVDPPEVDTTGANDLLMAFDQPRRPRRVDIGQSGTESWTVLADPEGNEFCILRPKKALIA